jgi:hypothetical protein
MHGLSGGFAISLFSHHVFLSATQSANTSATNAIFLHFGFYQVPAALGAGGRLGCLAGLAKTRALGKAACLRSLLARPRPKLKDGCLQLPQAKVCISFNLSR